MIKALYLMDARELDEMNGILSRKTPDPNYDPDDVIERYYVEFDESTHVDLEVCNGEPPYVNAVLYRNGDEDCVITDGCEGPLEGEWLFEASNGEFYEVKVQAK